MNCWHCGELLTDRGFFCKSCATQTRCMKCRELLETNAAACVECGTRVGEQSAKEITIPVAAPGYQTNRNTLSYHEDRNTRQFEASLSDTAIQGLGDVFGDLFLQRGTIRNQAMSHVTGNGRQMLDAVNDPPVSTALKDIPNEAAPTDPVVLASQPSVDQVRLLKIFNREGDSFELSDNRLKASTGAEYVKRLTYLYLYAHECYDKKSVSESELKDLLRSAKVLDSSGNAGKWLNKRVGIVQDGTDRIKLTAPGREEAVSALDAALDPNIPDAWNPDTATPQKRGSHKKKKT